MTDVSEMPSIRTADDSWDITESVGATALAVAAARAVETAQLDPLIRDEFAYLLTASAGPAWAQLASSEPDWLKDEEYGRRIHHMARDYQAVRTRYFDDFFSDAMRSGVRQVVILAAGLDSRAYRLDWPAGTTVFEIDQPKVLDYKASTLGAHGAVATSNRVAVAVDLRDEWPAALIAAGFDPGQPTAWLAEGLLPYLPADAQDRLFALIQRHSVAGSLIAVEVFTTNPAEQTAQQRASRRRRNESMRVRLGLDIDVDALMYLSDDRTDTVPWLTAHGWQVDAVASGDEMARLGRPVSEELADEGMDTTLVRGRLEGVTQ